MRDADELREQWALVNTPVGVPWSGRTRYAAAVYFYNMEAMSAEALEVYRISARLDEQDPLAIIAERGVGAGWLERFER